MDARNAERLAKVLALIDSSQEGEAGTALRLAKKILAREGLNFSDLTHKAANSAGAGAANPQHLRALGLTQAQLEQRLNALQHQFEALQDISVQQEDEIRQWQEQVRRLKDTVSKSRDQILYWRGVAQDTSDRLWDLGKRVGPLQGVLVRQTEKEAGAQATSFTSRRPLARQHLEAWRDWLSESLPGEEKGTEKPESGQ
ncbi:MAG: hypothetical protein GC131_07130 [Alphaproteobacteria bacterium]|nr:hypothetical protein [Alphaproteobacteria bacterium]